MRAPRVILLPFLAITAAACADQPTASATPVAETQIFRLELIGRDTFWIQDTPINPGCHYSWTMRAIGSPDTRAQLLGGRMLRTSDLGPSAVPRDTFYTWNTETIKPLFGGSEWFEGGEQRTSGPYATVSNNLPSSKNRVEFDFVVPPSTALQTTSQIFYCLRP